MSFLKQHVKFLTLLLVFLAGILITAPYVNYQDFLSQGDHGRDLYAAQAVYRGELPYRDFWWVYGPLMPYYYGLFFKIFGVHISSMILGKLILRILGGILHLPGHDGSFLRNSRLFYAPAGLCFSIRIFSLPIIT